MSKGWKETTLGEVCRLVKGISYKSSELVAEGEGIPFINLKSIDRGGGFRAEGLKWFRGNYKREQLVQAGDLVLCCTDLTKEKAILGYPLLVPKLDLGNQFCISLDMANLIVEKDMSTNEFMYLMLQGGQMREFMTSNSSGTTVMHLQTRNVVSAKVLLPPLAEQKRIVDVVSFIDAYIDALQQQAETARTARNAVLHELLSAGGDDWTETILGEIITLEYGKPLKAENRDGKGLPVFGSAGEVGLHSEPLVHDAPVIVVGRKGTAGAVWWSDLPCSVIDTAYYVVQKIDIDIRFLYFTMGHLDLPSLNAQTGVPGLNRDRAYCTQVLLPPSAEQKRIVGIVSSLDEMIQSTEQAVVEAKNLRSGLLSDLLSGEHEIPESYDRFLKAA